MVGQIITEIMNDGAIRRGAERQPQRSNSSMESQHCEPIARVLKSTQRVKIGIV
jgi:hypothetical protein